MDPPRCSCTSIRPRLPRASGDGPEHICRLIWRRAAAPRERGWTRADAVVLRRPAGCPARAGMDPAWRRHRAVRPRLPRASGDGPTLARDSQQSLPAAPRERGWTRPEVGARMRGHGCPARAGMDPAVPAGSAPPGGLPRASGDGPPNYPGQAPWDTAAPRERGWTLEGRAVGQRARGCPARAGMDPGPARRDRRRGRLPRASGDGPTHHVQRAVFAEAAPRERGWTLTKQAIGRALEGCPARAGMDPFAAGPVIVEGWLPRASGDGPAGAVA